MSNIDWLILVATLGFIVIYGAWRNRFRSNMEEFLSTSRTTPWYVIGISVMATQASAITFLSTPGQAFEGGMGFIQFYFGLPLAVIVICVTMIPIYQRLNVLTAYEYLESRFDRKTRQLTAFLFLVQRGLAAGITIYAPAIVLCKVLGVDLNLLNLFVGLAVTLYTVSGGSEAVNRTQLLQVGVIFVGVVSAVAVLLFSLPQSVSFLDAISLAGALGKMELVDFSFDPTTRYTFWSGITGGFFLALSYLGTDQSQVGRYLTSHSIKTSQYGLIFNGLLKVPMQFFILLIGVLLFAFYIFSPPPLFFNKTELNKLDSASDQAYIHQLESRHLELFNERKAQASKYLEAKKGEDLLRLNAEKELLQEKQAKMSELDQELDRFLRSQKVDVEENDTDYVFITFIVNNLPIGLVGLLIAAILSAAMSSTSSELNALASTTINDFYKRSSRPNASEKELLFASRFATLFWGGVAIAFATSASLFDNLIQAINIIGSVFYGTILGIFLTAFYTKEPDGDSVYYSALVSEGVVLYLYFTTDIGFLWFNVIGCLLTMALTICVDKTRGLLQGRVD